MTDQVATAQASTEAGDAGEATGQTLLTNGDAGDQAAKASSSEQGGNAGEQEDKASSGGAPEKYEFNMPEGVEFDAEAFKRFEPAMREMNLSNESAQKLVAQFAEFRKAEAENADAAFQQQIKDWQREVTESKDIAWQENGRLATAVYREIASPETREFLDSTGLGNHPQIVGLFVKVGQLLKESGRLGEDGSFSASSATKTKSLEERLYPNHKPD